MPPVCVSYPSFNKQALKVVILMEIRQLKMFCHLDSQRTLSFVKKPCDDNTVCMYLFIIYAQDASRFKRGPLLSAPDAKRPSYLDLLLCITLTSLPALCQERTLKEPLRDYNTDAFGRFQVGSAHSAIQAHLRPAV